MATPNLIRYSKLLSYKLGDPVALGTEDADLFSAELRLNYLSRAYGRLMRMMEAVSKETISRIFPDYYKTIEGQSVETVSLTSLNAFDIFDVYMKDDNQDEYYQANYIQPENYFRVKYGDSTEYYLPSEADNRFYYTIIDGTIKFLPTLGSKWRVDVLYKVNPAQLEYNGTVDIIIPHNFVDMLMTLAAEEAMYDLGDERSLAKAQVYAADIMRQLEIIIRKAQKEEYKEDNRTT